MLPVPPSIYLRLLMFLGSGRNLQDRVLCLGTLGTAACLAAVLLDPRTQAPRAIPIAIGIIHAVCAVALWTLRLRRAALAALLVAGLAFVLLRLG